MRPHKTEQLLEGIGYHQYDKAVGYTTGNDIFPHSKSNRRLIDKTYNELKKLDIDRPNNLIENEVQILTETF